MEISINPCGDTAVAVELAGGISPNANRQVISLCRALKLKAERKRVKVEIVPSYCGFMVHYSPLEMSFEEVCQMIECAANKAVDEKEAEAGFATVPVCYGGEFGPDMEDLCRHTGFSPEEVISIHSSGEYLVYMLGFTPGFPYLGGMDKRIAMPRLETPRPSIPWGSVGIAGEQTGVYPSASPGGWRLIGRTPLRLFSSETGETLLAAGMKLRFKPITKEEYRSLLEGRSHI